MTDFRKCDRCRAVVSLPHECVPPHRRCPQRNLDGGQCGRYDGHSGSHTLLISSEFLEAARAPRLGRDMDNSTDWPNG